MIKEIKGEHEDLIYKNRQFIQELKKIEDLYWDTLLAELIDDGFDESIKDWLFDYVFNSEDNELFEEYLENHGYNRRMAALKDERIP